MVETSEPQKVVERYGRRKALPRGLYDPLAPDVYMARQEKERALIRWIAREGLAPLQDRRLLEIGCGSGGNLIEFMRLGFRCENLCGNELLEERLEAARCNLPQRIDLIAGDACELDLPAGAFDVVYQSTVFTSLLDDRFQERLAERMWTWVRPGGGVLWYDFVYNNPRNQDVRGVPFRRIRELFPRGEVVSWRVTLAPPLSRAVCRIHPNLYSVCNAVPWFRTHILAWIRKRAEPHA